MIFQQTPVLTCNCQMFRSLPGSILCIQPLCVWAQVHICLSHYLSQLYIPRQQWQLDGEKVNWTDWHTQTSASPEEQFREIFTMRKHTHGRHSRSGNCIGKSRAMRWVAVCNLLRTSAPTSDNIIRASSGAHLTPLVDRHHLSPWVHEWF